jgi:hypothetical protein
MKKNRIKNKIIKTPKNRLFFFFFFFTLIINNTLIQL